CARRWSRSSTATRCCATACSWPRGRRRSAVSIAPAGCSRCLRRCAAPRNEVIKASKEGRKSGSQENAERMAFLFCLFLPSSLPAFLRGLENEGPVRRLLIRYFLPLCFCVLPFLAALLVVLCLPRDALVFLREHVHAMDLLILGIGVPLFVLQVILMWRALRWQGTRFDESGDRWISNLAQAAEWFPMLGLIGTVGGILQTFSAIGPGTQPHTIIQLYAPAITATGA